MQGWITGLNNIAKYCDLSRDTILRYYNKYNFPLYILPEGQYMAIISEINTWIILSENNVPRTIRITPNNTQTADKQ